MLHLLMLSAENYYVRSETLCQGCYASQQRALTRRRQDGHDGRQDDAGDNPL